ncbi:MAG: hypothetical protein D6788_01085, partial [Planctomycetota bacterium]
ALWCGVREADGEWLLFTDADCRQDSPRTLSMAVREAVAHEADFLCITPTLVSETIWERIIQPVCTTALMTWFLPHRVNNPRRRTAYANGAFMLIRRNCYDAIGGHHSVKEELNEDIQLARRAKEAGFTLRVVENDGLYHTRMYDTFGQAWRGWSRIFYGSLRSPAKLLAGALLLLVMSVMPRASLIVALLGTFGTEASHAAWTWAVIAWGSAAVLEQAVMARVYSLLRAGALWSITDPLGAAVVVGMQLNALGKALGLSGTVWRGTAYAARSATQPSADATPPVKEAPAPSVDPLSRTRF